jgi:glucose-1-phosphate thymidylyltransferase
VTNKSLLPVYDRPLVEYPLSILLSAGIRDIILITGPDHSGDFMQYLGSGEQWNCKFTYRIQDKPAGIAQALGMTEEFIDGDNVCAILGDNIYFDDIGEEIRNFKGGAHIFLKEVSDPERFGVVEMSSDGKVVSIEEKPAKPKSNLAQTGCYIYDARCFDIIRNLRPSERGQLEVTDLNKQYLALGELAATILGDEWIDAGTIESFYEASTLVRNRKLAIAEKITSARASEAITKQPIASAQ